MGGMFHKPKAPKVQVQAPAVDQPIPDPVEPEMGTVETPEIKKRKGKKSLKIERNTGSSGSGRNIV